MKVCVCVGGGGGLVNLSKYKLKSLKVYAHFGLLMDSLKKTRHENFNGKRLIDQNPH